MTTALTPALLDLMEHEKVIEQGIAVVWDVAWALGEIKEGKKYRALGTRTWDDYCEQRWNMSPRHADRLIVARTIATTLETGPRGLIPPTSEGQVRPLAALPNDDDKREAWREALEESNGDQPTMRQVEKAVAKRRPPKRDHPAPYSDKIIETIAKHVEDAPTVLDPFAGTGRVHQLPNDTTGVELEQEWADKHPGTIQGDAARLSDHFEPESFDAIATSPTYGNRMADHHDATDDSIRHTYKHTLGRDLTPGNTGELQWGDEYRETHRAAWRESVAVLKPGGAFVLNVKNHIRAGEIQRVAEWHIETLMHEFGLHLEAIDIIATRGIMAGDNADSRVTHELVIKFRK